MVDVKDVKAVTVNVSRISGCELLGSHVGIEGNRMAIGRHI